MNLFPKMHISATTKNCHVIRLQGNISLYILRTFLFTFLLELTGRICLTIRSILNWWSFPLFSWPSYLIQGWYCEEKLETSHSWRFKGLTVHKKFLTRACDSFCSCSYWWTGGVACCYKKKKKMHSFSHIWHLFIISIFMNIIIITIFIIFTTNIVSIIWNYSYILFAFWLVLFYFLSI